MDSRGRVYLADAAANKVFQFSSTGSPLRTFGRLPRQSPAKYDPETFMSPEKLACWKDAEGKDYGVLVIDSFSHEWAGDGGVLALYRRGSD